MRTALLPALLCSLPVFAQTPICEVQGSGTASPFDGQVVSVIGTVTAVFQGAGTLQGYFVEDPLCDSNAETSNGIFVYQTTATGIAVGQRIQVTGEVDEFQGLTEIRNVSAVQQLGFAVVQPTMVELPFATLSDRERYEGMLLRFPQTLVVTDIANWVQYGEVVLGPDRPREPTDLIDPNDVVPSGNTTSGAGNVAAVLAHRSNNERGRIILDDGRTTSYPDPQPNIGPEGTLRTGSTVTDLVAVLSYAFNEYRLQPVGSVPMAHAARPAAPVVGGTLRAASLNVLNYWTTLGEWGANNTAELQRQRTKLVAALQTMDADVLVLCEVENNDMAWADLLTALNLVMGPGTYAAREEDAQGGGTKTVIFYKPGVLTPQTPLFSLYSGTFQRPHLTQGFSLNTTGARLLVSSVHLRSKICDNAIGSNADQGDGQGCYNAQRRAQAQELVAHWATVRSVTGIDAQLILGDFNAYTQEDPLDVLRAGGLFRVLPDDAYSYRFGGAFGCLDHAFVTTSLSQVVTGAEVWSINSDEPAELDYRDANLARYQPNAFRSSDHDALIVGVDAAGLPVGMEDRSLLSRSVHVHADGTMLRWMLTSMPKGPVEWTLYDAPGRVVRSGRATANAWGTDIQGIAAGTYSWRIAEATGVIGAGRVVLGMDQRW